MSNADSPDLLYGVSSISTFLGMTEKAARHLIEKGTVPSFKIGGRVCARRSTLTAWLAECEAKAQDTDPTDPAGQGGAGGDDGRE